MTAQHTHYDNLKVARNAPPEVIRAAYKSLAQKYHPDKYHDPVEAERIIKIINNAYEVLMDPETRAKYDVELARQDILLSSNQHTSAPATTTGIVTEKEDSSTDKPPIHPSSFNNEESFVNLKKTLLTAIIYGATVLVLALFTIKLIQPPPIKPQPSTNTIANEPQTPLEATKPPSIELSVTPNAQQPSSVSTPVLSISTPPNDRPKILSPATTGQVMRTPTHGEDLKTQKFQTVSYGNAEQLFQENRFIEAETMIDALLTQSPNHSKAWRLKGMLQASRGNTGAATKAFATYLQTSNNNEESIAALKNLATGKNSLATGIQQAARQALINNGKE